MRAVTRGRLRSACHLVGDFRLSVSLCWNQRVLDNMPLRPGLTHHSSGPTRSGWVYAQPARSHSSLPFSVLSDRTYMY